MKNEHSQITLIDTYISIDNLITMPNDICLFINRSLSDEEKILVRINHISF